MTDRADMSAVRVVGAEVEVAQHLMEHPMVLSSGTITHLPEITARVQVSDGSTTATGWGAVNLSDVWAWPDRGDGGANLSSQEKRATMEGLCQRLAAELADRTGDPAHPLELGIRLHDSVLQDSASVDIPALARLVCASALDAALHDGAGRLAGRSAFSLYDNDVEIPSLDEHFTDGAMAAVRAVLRPPVAALDGWWAIAPGDDLDTAGAQAQHHGMRRFKIKLPGRDPQADAVRVNQIHTAAHQWTAHPMLSVDTNEGSSDTMAVATFLEALGELSGEAVASITHLEQPTPRDSLAGHDWTTINHDSAPILLDEGLGSFGDLELARQQGWDGLALKTCKGHSFALAAAAWAHQHGLALTVQDLTNIGRSAIHSWLFAAHLRGVESVELNSPQYLPRANAPWLPRLSGLFDIRDGRHRLSTDNLVGLGSDL